MLRREQLLELGLGVEGLRARLATARLHRKHAGVYTLGHGLLRPRGEWYAAVWAVPGCVLSHQSAAAFHGWIEPEPTTQHVTTRGKARSRPGLRVHRVTDLWSADIAQHGLLWVTTPSRTIVDLAVVMPWAQLRAIADQVRSLDVKAIRAAQRRAPHRPGARNVRRLCERLEAHTRSEFERRYLRFCRRHRIALPTSVNTRVAGSTVDCRYDERRLVIELDGRAFHSRQDQMRRDRRRDRKALLAGFATVRFVWEDFDADAAPETVHDLLELVGGG